MTERARTLAILRAASVSGGAMVKGSTLNEMCGPGAFEDACLLARGDEVPFPLLSKIGNVGMPGWPPAPAENVELGVGDLGALYRDCPGVRPAVELMLGDLHFGGTRPPLAADWLLGQLSSPPEPELDLPVPSVSTGSDVTGDLRALIAGDDAVFVLTAVIRSSPERLVIDRVPWPDGAYRAATAVSEYFDDGRHSGAGWNLEMPSDTEVVLTARDRSAEPAVLAELSSQGITRREVLWRFPRALADLLAEARDELAGGTGLYQRLSQAVVSQRRTA